MEKIEAEITVNYQNTTHANVIKNSVSIDNCKTKGIYIKTRTEKNKIITKVICKRIPTFIATVDDFLFCLTLADKVVKTTKQLK